MMDRLTQLVDLFASNVLLYNENEAKVESFKKRNDSVCIKESDASINSANLDTITLEQIEEQTKQLNDTADELEEYLQQLESLCARYSSEIVSIEEDIALDAKFKEEVICGTFDKQGEYIPSIEVTQPIYDLVFNVFGEKTFVEMELFGNKEIIPFIAKLFGAALCSWIEKGKLSKFIYQKIIASFETAFRELETKEQRIYYVNSLWWIIKILEEQNFEKCDIFQTIYNPSERKGETPYGRFMTSLKQLLFRLFTDFTVDICNTSIAPLLSLMKEESAIHELIKVLTEWENFFVEQNTPTIIQKQFAGQFIIFISYSTFNNIAVRSQNCSPELGIYVKLNISNLISWLQRNQFDEFIVYLDPLSQAANAISLMNTELLCDGTFSAETFPSLNRAQVLTLAMKIDQCKGEKSSKIENELSSTKVSKMSIMMDPFAEANVVQAATE